MDQIANSAPGLVLYVSVGALVAGVAVVAYLLRARRNRP